MRIKFLLFVALVTFSANSFAGILIEPYLGYMTGKNSGSVTINTPITATLDVDSTTKGAAFGGRLGYDFLLLGAGVEAMSGSLDTDGDDSKLTNLGAFVSFDLPIMLRFFGTYFFSSKFSTETGGVDYKYKGNGFKAGVGLTTLPFVSINLEYFSMNYENDDTAVLDNADVNYKGFMLGVSLPLSL
ncbi:MAG: hypothetical protein A2Z20_12255 [Bdellovibrionales bacterium RBG_16_40_8]|nr:MAG: hypothetical protein A2Z20_12255 [Bdellovibrionales bacterium RBG_16_40_8]